MDQRLTDTFIFLFERDLKKLESEISLYSDEPSLWRLSGAITNPAGNLCLHLCGNLQHYVGALLGNSGYIRNRPLEFSLNDIPKTKLLAEIKTTRDVVIHTLKNLKDEDLSLTYPEETLGYPMTTHFFLTHLFGHLGYHLGQINYHRRIICSAPIESIH
jgi:hypothetical protein